MKHVVNIASATLTVWAMGVAGAALAKVVILVGRRLVGR
jgi:hypothetical protein